MNDPLVTIITPLLNTVDYVESSVQSVLNQDYQNVEHLFVDGGSTDGSDKIVREYEGKYPGKVRLIEAPSSTVAEAWEIGYQKAKGSILGSIGADDTCEPGAIKTVANLLKEDSSINVIQGHCDVVSPQGDLIMRNEATKFNVQDFINTAYYVATPSVYYRHEVIEKIGGLSISGDDFDVMIRMAQLYDFFPVDQVFSKLMVREGTAFKSKDFNKRKESYYQTYLVSQKYGGSRWSPLAKRYYVAKMLEVMKLQRFFPIIRQFYRWLRGVKLND
jgi:glycosyltransferase involved in cell wall biosynthesis